MSDTYSAPAEQEYRIEYMYHMVYKRRGDYFLTLKAEEKLSESDMVILDRVLGDTLRIEEQLRNGRHETTVTSGSS